MSYNKHQIISIKGTLCEIINCTDNYVKGCKTVFIMFPLRLLFIEYGNSFIIHIPNYIPDKQHKRYIRKYLKKNYEMSKM